MAALIVVGCLTCGAAAAQTEGPTPQELVHQALELIDADKAAEALGLLDQAVADARPFHQALYHRARCLWILGDGDAALADLDAYEAGQITDAERIRSQSLRAEIDAARAPPPPEEAPPRTTRRSIPPGLGFGLTFGGGLATGAGGALAMYGIGEGDAGNDTMDWERWNAGRTPYGIGMGVIAGGAASIATGIVLGTISRPPPAAVAVVPTDGGAYATFALPW